MGVQRRCLVIDWLASVYRVYLVIWAAGIPSELYLRELQQRKLKTKMGWFYLQPTPSHEESFGWASLGFVRVWDPWAGKPLPES